MHENFDHEPPGRHLGQPVHQMILILDRRHGDRDEFQVEHASFDRGVNECRDRDLLVGAADDLALTGPDGLPFVAYAHSLVIAQASGRMTDQGLDRLADSLRSRASSAPGR